MTAHEPVCIAVILCDQVIEDRITGNKSYINTFSKILVTQVPVIHPRFSIVVSVTDGRGEHPVRIEILRDDSERGEVADFQITGTLRMLDPLEVSDAVFNVVNYKITTLGRHTIRVTLGAGKMIYQRAFQVIRGHPPLGRPADGRGGAP